MSIIRYQIPTLTPFALRPLTRLSAFQNEVNRLFDFPAHGREAADSAAWMPALDIQQDKDQVVVKVELPGLKKEDVTISLHDEVLTIAGERRQENAAADQNYVRSERFFGKFERRLSLPTAVDGARVNAAYEDGILTVTLPTAEAAKPRQIEIKAK